MQIKTEDTWLTPYKQYFANKLIPSELVKAKIIKRNIRYTLIDDNLFR